MVIPCTIYFKQLSNRRKGKVSSMFDDLQLIHMSVRILRFWSLIYQHTWRRYVCLSMTTFLVFTQLYYMFRTSEGIDSVIRNSYMLVLWFNTILRAYLLLYDREKYEKLLSDLEQFYYDLKVRAWEGVDIQVYILVFIYIHGETGLLGSSKKFGIR